jgi:hypothetical protein
MSSIEGFLRRNTDGDMWQQQKSYHNNDAITFGRKKNQNVPSPEGSLQLHRMT